jgi:outer membrane protein assembly factor BamB
MPSEHTSGSRSELLPRVWPALVLVAAYWVFRLVLPWLQLPIYAGFFSMVGAAGLLVLLFFAWWLLSLRIRLKERLLALVMVAVGAFLAQALSDPSIGWFSVLIIGLPIIVSLWSLWFLVARRRSVAIQRWGLLAILALVWGPMTIARNDGIDGSQRSTVHWRWSPKAEELFLAERNKSLGSSPSDATKSSDKQVSLKLTPGDWPGFRGAERDGTLRGVQFATDWEANPPKLVWRQRVGPGWSSFTVIGDRVFTQEQRGDVEAVVCLSTADGTEIWSHQDKARFWDMVAGAGPRATPSFDGGQIFTLGATGILSSFDAATGRVHWSRNIVDDSAAPLPMWGFSSSPLVADGMVIVYSGGAGDKGLLAYHADSGKLAWTAATGPISYSSPQLLKVDGETHVLLLSDEGLRAVRPTTGTTTWEYTASAPNIWRAVQPRSVGDRQVIIGSEDLGLVLLDLARDGQAWTAKPHWTSKAMRPAYNDFVLQDGFLYGFDGGIFCCTDVDAGKRRWKAGRYGHGQVLLVADQRLLVVLSETGEVVLVRATPEKHQEVGRLQAIQGKTWNHPVIAHGCLYVRNDEEMACYRLQLIETPKAARIERPVAAPR